jgi:Domain of unknown function (DUF5668)/B-box zinc finger
MNCANHPDVAAVAYCRTCGKPMCANCMRSVNGVIYCESCLAARIEGSVPPPPIIPGVIPPPRSGGPNPALAGILAGFFPYGVGAVYTGQYAKGLAHLLIFVGILWGIISGHGHLVPLFGISMGFFYVYQIIDAIRSASAIQAGQAPPDPFGLTRTFSTGERADKSNVPTGAIILVGLGVLFMLHTMDIMFFSFDRFWPLILIGIGVWLFIKRWGLAGQAAPTSCSCDRCRARCLMGPAVLVTLGTLFLIDNVVSFGRTWPALLIIIGLIKVYQGNASNAGHIETQPPVMGPGVVPPMPPPPQPPPPSEVIHG